MSPLGYSPHHFHPVPTPHDQPQAPGVDTITGPPQSSPHCVLPHGSGVGSFLGISGCTNPKTRRREPWPHFFPGPCPFFKLLSSPLQPGANPGKPQGPQIPWLLLMGTEFPGSSDSDSGASTRGIGSSQRSRKSNINSTCDINNIHINIHAINTTHRQVSDVITTSTILTY